jgi:hypothetical protein
MWLFEDAMVHHGEAEYAPDIVQSETRFVGELTK